MDAMGREALCYFIVSYEGYEVVREQGPIHGGRNAALKWLDHYRQAEPHREHHMEGRMPDDKESARDRNPPFWIPI